MCILQLRRFQRSSLIQSNFQLLKFSQSQIYYFSTTVLAYCQAPFHNFLFLLFLNGLVIKIARMFQKLIQSNFINFFLNVLNVKIPVIRISRLSNFHVLEFIIFQQLFSRIPKYHFTISLMD